MSIAWTRLPFRFDTPSDYARKVSEWIGQAFYERLPAAGYQVREEQIYLAFRIAAALADGRTMLAEGGSGTGKTFAYLLPLICHARLRGRPAVVATASPTLLDQLAGPDGDVQALSRLLHLDVDARVALRPEDAVCDIRAEAFRAGGRRRAGRTALLRWWEGSAYGARHEHPEAPDDLWAEVAWRPACRCEVCPRRGYCRMMKGRARMRAAADLIVCGHDTFFADAWGRQRAGHGLPLLPPYSAVVFDEGHRVAAAAQRAGGWHFVPGRLAAVVRSVEGQGARLRLLAVAEAAEQAAGRFAGVLDAASAEDKGQERRAVRREPDLVRIAGQLAELLRRLQDEVAVEEGLHEETAYGVRLAGAQLAFDAARETLGGVLQERGSILWREGDTLWTVPADLGPVWACLGPGVPAVFSSATLAASGSFAYTTRVLGLRDPLTARVGVPFRLARQVLCYLPEGGPDPAAADFWTGAAEALAHLCQATGGRALVLVPERGDLAALHAAWTWSGRTLWEGEGAPESLVAAFAADECSVLAAYSLWEGVDVPGAALSVVAVPLLPLPGLDPPVDALRERAAEAGIDPQAAVDVPVMALRLRQGLGRLIRTETDRGVVAVLDRRAAAGDLRTAVEAVLPAGARRVRTLGPVRRFLSGKVEAGAK